MRFMHLKTKQEVASLIEWLNAHKCPVVLDIETTGLDRFNDKLISFQLCMAGHSVAYYIEGEHCGELANLAVPLVLHNFKFDYAFLYQYASIDLRNRVGVPTAGPDAALWLRDTMLMHHLLDENGAHNLDALVRVRWNDDYKEQFWSKYKNFQDAPLEEQIDYSCKDVVYTGMLYKAFCEELAVQKVPESLINHVHQLALSLYDTELQGVCVDLDYLVKTGEALKARIIAAKEEMRALAPEAETVELAMWSEELDKRKTPKGRANVKRPEFNWDSGKQLQALIYGELGIKPKLNKQKRPTLDDAALEDLQDEHPVISRLRDYRADQKVFGSFIEGTLDRQVGGRVYPSFNICGTVTGRISSSNPNLQQLPRDGGVRGIYVPSPGHLLISCDYAQLEVVVAAHYSQDKALLKIIYEGASKHDITAEALGIPRQTAKTVNFAAQYQCSHYKLASILGVSEQEGMNAWKKYWETYSGEKKVIDECKVNVDRGNPICNLFGRQRHFPTVFNTKWEKEAAYRQAYSSLIQGTGADITHTAYYRVYDRYRQKGLGRSLFQVHDEILTEAKEEVVNEAKEVLVSTMVDAGKVLSVPLGVDCSEPLVRWTK